jgi:hypothetical protein
VINPNIITSGSPGDPDMNNHDKEINLFGIEASQVMVVVAVYNSGFIQNIKSITESGSIVRAYDINQEDGDVSDIDHEDKDAS